MRSYVKCLDTQQQANCTLQTFQLIIFDFFFLNIANCDHFFLILLEIIWKYFFISTCFNWHFLSGLITQTLNSSIWQRMWSHFVISIFHFILIVLLRDGRWTPKVGDVPMLTRDEKWLFKSFILSLLVFLQIVQRNLWYWELTRTIDFVYLYTRSRSQVF